jgi:hypothetical protein
MFSSHHQTQASKQKQGCIFQERAWIYREVMSRNGNQGNELSIFHEQAWRLGNGMEWSVGLSFDLWLGGYLRIADFSTAKGWAGQSKATSMALRTGHQRYRDGMGGYFVT